MIDQMVSTESPIRLPERLVAVLASLTDARADGLTEAECVELMTLLESTKGAAAALQARVTTRFVEQRDADAEEARARGGISAREVTRRRSATRSEVALARRCSPGQADHRVRHGLALCHDLRHTMAALTSGELSEYRATIVARETACLSAEHRAEVDARIAPDLRTLGDKALAGAVQRASIDVDQESIVRRRERAVAERCVSVRPAPDGMAWLSILGPMVDVVGAMASLTAAEKARWVATGDPEVDRARADDDRGRGAWLADTALERLSGRHEGEAQPVEVGLVMTDSALFRAADEDDGGAWVRPGAAEVPGWGAVPTPAAREHVLRLLDAAEGEAQVWLRRLYTSPDARDLVAMDSRRRFFTGALRSLIELRDPTCRVSWCDAPTRDIDHARRAADGGGTSADNGWGTCRRHNLDKEAPGWRTVVAASGLDPGGGPHVVHLRTPTGGEHRCPAPPLLGHGRQPTVRQSRLEAHFERLLGAA